MSITIRHLSGPYPLKGQLQTFASSKDRIIFGRSGECDIRYPSECEWIAPLHLRLERSKTGQLELEVLSGHGAVKINGKELTKADDPMGIGSGSVVSIGDNGPSFCIDTLAVTVRHLEGPLAGKVQTFDESVRRIEFGRQANEVVYPPDYRIIGKHHFALERKGYGRYGLNLTDGHYVEIDGSPATNVNTVGSRSEFRLGSSARFFGLSKKKGPSFELLIEGPPHDTEENFEPKTWQEGYRELIAGLVVVALLSVGVGGYVFYRDTRFDSAVKELRQNVYLIVKDDGGVPKAEATAFVIGNDTLATNAHVTQELRGAWPGEFYLLGPENNRVEIAEVESHPGYMAFEARKHTFGVRRGTSFKPLSLPSAYDVGLIRVDQNDAPLSDGPLKLASEKEVKQLTVGSQLISAGFPLEGLKGTASTPIAPSPTFGNGMIRRVVDIFQGDPEDSDHGLILVHDIPVAGGVSGSPLVDIWSGKVVAVVSGGNVVSLRGNLQENALGNKDRTPSASMVNFAHRIDVLHDLIAGKALKKLARDETEYWEPVGGRRYDRYATLVAELFLKQAKTSYDNKANASEEIARAVGVLKPGDGERPEAWQPRSTQDTSGSSQIRADDAESYSSVRDVYDLKAEPGFVYGFLLETTDMPVRVDEDNPYADPATIRLTPKTALLKPQTLRKSTESYLEATAWASVDTSTMLQIKVAGTLKRPSNYTLHAYRWRLPSVLSTTAPPAAKDASR